MLFQALQFLENCMRIQSQSSGLFVFNFGKSSGVRGRYLRPDKYQKQLGKIENQ